MLCLYDGAMVKEHPFPIGLAIHELSRLLRREYEARARQLGFTEGQWRTLWHLQRNQGFSQVRLAEILEMQPISLVRVLDRLESAGLIERRPDPRDRRAVQLYLTPAAGPVLESLRRIGEDLDAAMKRHISLADADQLLASLQRMRGAFDARADQLAHVNVG